MEKALEMIQGGRKPFIFVGGGAVAFRMLPNELSAFAHKIQAPVGDTLMGKGAFDGTDAALYRYDRYARNQDIQPRCEQSATC